MPDYYSLKFSVAIIYLKLVTIQVNCTRGAALGQSQGFHGWCHTGDTSWGCRVISVWVFTDLYIVPSFTFVPKGSKRLFHTPFLVARAGVWILPTQDARERRMPPQGCALFLYYEYTFLLLLTMHLFLPLTTALTKYIITPFIFRSHNAP